MPIYEFECTSCGSQFELLRSFSETSAPHCPSCNSEHVERQLGRPAIHFKGSGWYINDSKKASKDSANGTATEGTGGDAKKSADMAPSADGTSSSASSSSASSTAASGAGETAKSTAKTEAS